MDDRSPRLLWSDDGSPRSGRFADVYFSKDDGLAESRAVFLAGADLPQAWQAQPRFCVAELGFGTGLNIAALLDLWRREGPEAGHLSIFSIEGFPLSREEAERALSAWSDVRGATQALLAGWPDGAPGRHRIDLPGWRATLDLHVGDVVEGLEGWDGAADAWFLDGFSPALNPEMWSDAVFDRIVARSAPGARVATFTVAGAVRRALEARGFEVAKRPGHGRKRERLEARLTGAPPAFRSTPARIAVIGAGVAGAALARAFAQLGLACTVVEAEALGAGASGFPAALVTPRLDVGDAGLATLHAQALRRAGSLYEQAGAVLARGVLQLPGQARDHPRFAKVAGQDLWSAGAMTMLEAVETEAQQGEAVGPGLMMRDAMAIAPAKALQDWLADADRMTATVSTVEAHQAGWRLLDAAGAELLQADVVVMAAGWGSRDLAPMLALSPVRGQAAWIEGPTTAPMAWGGYAAPTTSGLLFGATHDRDDASSEVRPEDRERLLATLRSRAPHLTEAVEAAAADGGLKMRAAVRATTPDRSPIAGEIAPGLFVLTGLGSRGFCLAPLLAEHVAALVAGAPSPLPTDLAARIAPDRPALRRLVQPSPPPQD